MNEHKCHITTCAMGCPDPCPITSSSHEKALARVVEKEDGMYTKDVIQTLCGCGHIISEAEIKSK